MTEVIQFVSKEKLETERMIKKARELYESVFPTDQEMEIHQAMMECSINKIRIETGEKSE